MMATLRTTPAPTDVRLGRYYHLGLDDQAIAQRLGLSPWTVRAHRQRLGLLRGPRPGPAVVEGDLLDAHAAGLTTTEIAARLGCTRRTAQEYLYRLGLRAHRQRSGSGR